MGPDRLDKFIKNQVEQHKTPTDPDLLWQKIQAKQNVEEKPKRRFIIFWLLAGALLLTTLGLLYTYYTLNNDDNTLTSNENPIENTSANTISNTNTNTNTNSNSNSSLSSSSNSTHLSDETTPSSKVPTEEKTPNEFANKNALTKSDYSKPKTTNNSETEQTANNVTNNSERLATAKTKTTDASTNDTKTPKLPTTPSVNTDVHLNSNKPSSNTSTTIVEQKNANTKNNELPTGKQEKNSNTSEVNTIAFAKSELLLISNLDFLLKDQDISNEFIENQKEKKNFPNYRYKESYKLIDNNWTFSNGLAFTYGTAPRTLSARESTNNDYLQSRNDLETSLDAVRLNLDFMAQHRSGFYLKSGAEYEQINERYELYTSWDSIIIDPNQIVAIVITQDGDSTSSFGNQNNLINFWNNKRRYNRYHSIDIPILVGYNSAKADKKLSWFIEAGVSMNLWFKARGEINNTEGEAIRLEDNPDLFKPRTGFSLLAATGLSYRLNDTFSIWASPSIKYHLSSITSKENTLDQKYLNVGLQVGVRYHWTK